MTEDLQAPRWLARLSAQVNDPWLTLPQALALVYGVPLVDVHTSQVAVRDEIAWLGCIDLRLARAGEDDNENRRSPWVVVPVASRIAREWSSTHCAPATEDIGILRHRLIAGLMADAMEASTLLDVDDIVVDADDPVVVGLVRMWWKIESAQGMSVEAAWMLIGLHPAEGMTRVALAAGIPALRP